MTHCYFTLIVNNLMTWLFQLIYFNCLRVSYHVNISIIFHFYFVFLFFFNTFLNSSYFTWFQNQYTYTVYANGRNEYKIRTYFHCNRPCRVRYMQTNNFLCSNLRKFNLTIQNIIRLFQLKYGFQLASSLV